MYWIIGSHALNLELQEAGNFLGLQSSPSARCYNVPCLYISIDGILFSCYSNERFLLLQLVLQTEFSLFVSSHFSFSHCSHILKRSFLHNQCFLLLNILLAFSEF